MHRNGRRVPEHSSQPGVGFDLVDIWRIDSAGVAVETIRKFLPEKSLERMALDAVASGRTHDGKDEHRWAT